jgi:cytochrome c-type biogenesis protein CcmF
MNEIQYIGEHLLPGRLGHLAIVLSFVSGLLAAVSYYFATNKRGTEEEANWKNLGRSAFIVHGLSIFAVIGIIFYVMAKQYYEYQYVWAHVNEDLPFNSFCQLFGKARKGVSCCGCSGMWCWD